MNIRCAKFVCCLSVDGEDGYAIDNIEAKTTEELANFLATAAGKIRNWPKPIEGVHVFINPVYNITPTEQLCPRCKRYVPQVVGAVLAALISRNISINRSMKAFKDWAIQKNEAFPNGPATGWWNTAPAATLAGRH